MTHFTCWKWGALFGPEYVNTLRSMLARHFHAPFTLHCITDDPSFIEEGIHIIPIEEYQGTPRCRRRMVQYAEWWRHRIGSARFINLDLDIVITGDVTPLFDTAEPLKFWKVGYAGVYSGSVQLIDGGALHPLYEMFRHDPEGFPKQAWPRGIGSDQAMLNYYLTTTLEGFEPPTWTEADGIYTFFGAGYERFSHLGVSMASQALPDNCKLVVMGSADKWILDQQALPCLTQHWR